ncbi:MAG TPA: hypothetical protein VJJ47_00460 [Candidatus Paceibacterota bacterium]
MPDSPTKKETGLREYIDQNSNLITALGVFSALTLFSTDLETGIFAAILSLVCLTCTILIWLELWEAFPAKDGGAKIIWFENALALGTLALVVYWLTKISDLYTDALVFVIGLTIMWPISLGLKKWNVFNSLFNAETGQKKFLRHVVGWTLIIAIYSVCITFGYKVAPHLKGFIDEIRVETHATSTFSQKEK